MPSVALHVVEFTFQGGFESLPLRHYLSFQQLTCLFTFRFTFFLPVFRLHPDKFAGSGAWNLTATRYITLKTKAGKWTTVKPAMAENGRAAGIDSVICRGWRFQR